MVHTRSREVTVNSSSAHRGRSSSPVGKRRGTGTKDRDSKRGPKVGVAGDETPPKTRRTERSEAMSAGFSGSTRRPVRCLRRLGTPHFNSSSNRTANGYVERGTRSSSLKRKQAKTGSNTRDVEDEDNEDETEDEPAPTRSLKASASASVTVPLSERLRQRKEVKVNSAASSSTRNVSDTPVKQQQDLDDGVDMYTRVKRIRRQVKRDMYGMPLREEGKSTEEDDELESSDEEQEEDEGGGEEVEDDDNANEGPRSYFLRQHKPRTQLFEAAPIEPRRKERNVFKSTSRKKYRDYHEHKSFMSPARRLHRKRAAFHGSSSTSCSSDEDGSDERRFERRKAKSMLKSRQRCLPMNFKPDDVVGTIKERQRIGASLADIDPMYIDRSVTFESVGGLGEHLRALKEMVVFPLLYPEVFERFKITPPRGVLFYGPPGTGKTLVARALANECSHGEKRVAFFMRKGADCLSKWVGESERQLRLLFDQAYQMRPSIIFFDEIDGLAPVRSSRQDQIHSSIVSTLLALMDGLDSRGEVVIIGATNRIDSIDPALRRPGRFDRELLFSLPSAEARKQILKIHTKDWIPKLLDSFVEKVAEKCVGYCGADLKALCTEAALQALRRRYPQIYASEEKLQLDVSSIALAASDFECAMLRIVPAGRRSAECPGRALSASVRPLLARQFAAGLLVLKEIFAVVADKGPSTCTGLPDSDAEGVADVSASDELSAGREALGAIVESQGPVLSSARRRWQQYATTYRPRLLLAGHACQGQTIHLAPAFLHHFEHVRTHVLDVASLYSSNVRSPEESCSNVFREARRYTPSIIYMPHIDTWWDVAGETLRATMLTLIEDIEPVAAVLLLATSDEPYAALPHEVKQLFRGSDHDSNHVHAGQIICMQNANDEERREFFKDLLLHDTMRPPPKTKRAGRGQLEVLPKAPPPVPRSLTEGELRKLRQQEEATLRELRLFLRDVLNKLARDRKFQIFAKRVDENEVPDYYEIITKPMDLGTIMSKIDLHFYQTVGEFLSDIDLICSNALYYNPDTDVAGRAIRHRACALRDSASALVASELDPEFETQCKEIAEARQKRGELPTSTAPEYYHTRPPASDGVRSTKLAPQLSEAADCPTRYSRRIRGMGTGADGMPMADSAADEIEAARTDAPDLASAADAGSSLSALVSSANGDVQSCSHAVQSRSSTQQNVSDAAPASSEEQSCVAAASLPREEQHDMDVTAVLGDSLVAKAMACAASPARAADGALCLDALPVSNASPPAAAAAPLCNGHSDASEPRHQEMNSEKPMPLLQPNEAGDSADHHDELPPPLSISCNSTGLSRSSAIPFDDDSVHVSFPQLLALLDDVVERTSGFDVDRLEHIHAALSRKICQYRTSSNRSQMAAELEQLVRHIT